MKLDKLFLLLIIMKNKNKIQEYIIRNKIWYIKYKSNKLNNILNNNNKIKRNRNRNINKINKQNKEKYM